MRIHALVFGLGFLVACGGGGSATSTSGGNSGGGGSGGEGGSGGGSSALTYTFETLGTRNAKIDQTVYQAELIAAHRSDGGTSYLMVIPNPKPGGGVVVEMAPYTGIDWTGQEVDLRHAKDDAGPFGAYPDTDAPLEPPSTAKCAYGFVSAEDQIIGETYHLLNGHSAIVAFGRFYAGGSIADDAADAAAPFHYLAEHAKDFDLTRIGVYGASWGGFMALQGIAGRPSGMKIHSATALYPPTDFAALHDYWIKELPAVYPFADELSFFEGYRRRIEVQTGGPPATQAANFEPWSKEALCPRLDGDILVPQDDWDTLVPAAQTEAFLAICKNVKGLFWRRNKPVDYAQIHLAHGALEMEPGFSSSQTLGFLHVHRGLAKASDSILAYYQDAALRVFFQTVHDAQVAGKDITYANSALADLLDSRVIGYDMGTMMATLGPDLVTKIVGDIWGKPVTAADLVNGFPAP